MLSKAYCLHDFVYFVTQGNTFCNLMEPTKVYGVGGNFLLLKGSMATTPARISIEITLITHQ